MWEYMRERIREGGGSMSIRFSRHRAIECWERDATHGTLYNRGHAGVSPLGLGWGYTWGPWHSHSIITRASLHMRITEKKGDTLHECPSKGHMFIQGKNRVSASTAKLATCPPGMAPGKAQVNSPRETNKFLLHQGKGESSVSLQE